MIDKIKNSIFGYDIFISYSRKDSLNYAYAIAEHFMKKGYECYIDQLSSISPGKRLPSNIRNAVKRSTAFVLVGSKGAQLSTAIAKEIQVFLLNNKNKPVIPISIENNINEDAIWYKNIEGLALINDSLENLNLGKPKKKIFDRIQNALKFTKKSIRLRKISLLVFFLIIAISGSAFFYSSLKTKEANDANYKAQESLKDKREADDLANIALQKQSKSIEQMNQAIKLKEQALIDKMEIDSLKRIADKEVSQLNFLNKISTIRTSAIDSLQEDPVVAYRLAEKAYKLQSNSRNRELLLKTISSIDYYYKISIKGYKIIDFKEPYILLKKTENNSLAVYEMLTSSIKVTPIEADTAWIIPNGDSWRILTRNWNGSGFDGIAEYQLWSNTFVAIGKKIQEGGISIAKFIKNYKVKIKLQKQNEVIIWDLLNNTKEYIDETKNKDNYFYNIYGSLATRSDGFSAIYFESGLALTDSVGKVKPESHTNVSFDPSSFFTKANWSSDNQYLALNYFDRKRLGIWDPTKTSFVWLDPDGWVINSYAWSQNGHLLAFAGRTENEVDVTVEVLNANNPRESRRVIYKGEIPIQHVAFLPGDKFLAITNKENDMKIIDISNNEVIGQGKQANKIYSSKFGLYSSGFKDFKSWSPVPAPAKYWSFNANSIRTYSPQGAADPKFKWIAVPFVLKIDTIAGIELRNPSTGRKKILSYPIGYVHEIEFSNDGNWLILLSSKKVHIWDTRAWKYYEFNLAGKDRQFISLKIEAKILYAKVVNSSKKVQVNYTIDLKNSEPKFLKRIVSNNEQKDNHTLDNKESLKLIKGWKIKDLYKYRSYGWEEKENWVIRYTCRDNSLGANDCDVTFIPKDIEWLMELYDGLLWARTMDSGF